MEEDKLIYVELEVGGIQNYILSTGKLKEMIGGSEIVERLSKNVFNEIYSNLSLRTIKVETDIGFENKLRSDCNSILVLQANAGALHILFSNKDRAKEFINEFGNYVLSHYPGLPLYSALCECDWNSIYNAKKDVNSQISKQRALRPTSNGPQMQPIFRKSRIDGDTAVAIDYTVKKEKEYISLSSFAKRQDSLIKAANKRLQELIISKDFPLYWPQDLEELCTRQDNSENNKIAFIHMDGNDLGIMFKEAIKEFSDDRNEDESIKTENIIKRLSELSHVVSESSKEAFKFATEIVLNYIKKSCTAGFIKEEDDNKIIVPIRPLVLGGDDVTVVVRADLAMLFIHNFIRRFESYTQNTCHKKLTLGVGMVVCNQKYPFLKAFERCEDLIESAKKVTLQNKEDRKSSMDYLVITNEPELNLKKLRISSCMTLDKAARLTGKPFIFSNDNFIPEFLKAGFDVLCKLPRSQIRGAMTNLRKGINESEADYKNLKQNLSRNIGGRNNKVRMTEGELENLFSKDHIGFFNKDVNNTYYTLLPDYLELTHLLPDIVLNDENEFNLYLENMKD